MSPVELDNLTSIAADQIREMPDEDFKQLGPMFLAENLQRNPEHNFIQTDEGPKQFQRNIDQVEKYLINDRLKSFYDLLTVLDEEQLESLMKEFTQISMDRFRPNQ